MSKRKALEVIEYLEAHEKWHYENGTHVTGMGFRRAIWGLERIEGLPKSKSPYHEKFEEDRKRRFELRNQERRKELSGEDYLG